MPTLVKNQVKTLVEDHFEVVFADNEEQLQQFEHEMEIWDGSQEREIQERLSTEHVIEADSIMFDKNVSLIEFYKPDSLEQVIKKINDKITRDEE